MSSVSSPLLIPAARTGHADRVRPADPSARSAVAAALAVLALAGVALTFAVMASVPPRDLVRDPAPYLGTPLHVGLLSTSGVLLWAGACALLTAAGQRPLLPLASFAAVCALDDAFLLHEEVLPAMGLPETLVMAGYAMAGVLVLHVLRSTGAAGRGALLVGLCLLGASAAVDLAGSPLALVSGSADDVRNMVEELLKLAGVTAWLTGSWQTCRAALPR